MSVSSKLHSWSFRLAISIFAASQIVCAIGNVVLWNRVSRGEYRPQNAIRLNSSTNGANPSQKQDAASYNTVVAIQRLHGGFQVVDGAAHLEMIDDECANDLSGPELVVGSALLRDGLQVNSELSLIILPDSSGFEGVGKVGESLRVSIRHVGCPPVARVIVSPDNDHNPNTGGTLAKGS
jgi:hypothetical protein